jgi:TrmH family RNA methyltransferase
MITSAEIKFIKSLSQKKFRDSSGLFVAEGEKLVAEALSSRFEVEKVYREEEIGEAAMARITGLSSPSPALALIHKPEDLSKGQVPEKGLFLALDGIRDPGNLGTILRIADWFGIEAVFCSEDTVDCFNPKVVQATMGAIFRVRVKVCPLPETLAALRSKGVPVFGTFLHGDSLYSAPLAQAGVIVLGSERDGVSPEVEATVTKRLTIPPYPADQPSGAESLNVATAAAIVCGEFRRRFITP